MCIQLPTASPGTGPQTGTVEDLRMDYLIGALLTAGYFGILAGIVGWTGLRGRDPRPQ